MITTINIELLKKEEFRLQHGAGDNEPIGGLGTNRYIAFCNEDATLVLNRCKEVLLLINQTMQKRILTDHEWMDLLPDYFVYRCRPERDSNDIAEQEIGIKNKIESCLSGEEYLVWENMIPWSFSGWIYWFQEMERYWYWWDAATYKESHIVVAVEIHEWPYPSGSLSWLFRGCGANYLCRNRNQRQNNVLSAVAQIYFTFQIGILSNCTKAHIFRNTSTKSALNRCAF